MKTELFLCPLLFKNQRSHLRHKVAITTVILDSWGKVFAQSNTARKLSGFKAGVPGLLCLCFSLGRTLTCQEGEVVSIWGPEGIQSLWNSLSSTNLIGFFFLNKIKPNRYVFKLEFVRPNKDVNKLLMFKSLLCGPRSKEAKRCVSRMGKASASNTEKGLETLALL